MLSISYKYILRQDVIRKNGTHSIILRLYQTINKKSAKRDISIKRLSVLPKDWNEETQRINKNNPKAKEYNMLLSFYENKLSQLLLQHEINNKLINIDELKNELFKKQVITKDYYSFANEIIELWKGKTSHETLRHYKASLSKLKNYAPKLQLSDITFDFLERYEYYMRNELNNSSNTVARSFIYIRQIWKEALERKIVSGNPFEKIKIKKTEPVRSFLTHEELIKLEQLYNQKRLPKKLQEALRCFLFQCYTGLRYGELKIFTLKNVVNNEITILQPKVDRTKYIPLSDYAKNILKENTEFHIVANQKYNEYLKLIAIAANIDKHISTHTARHTFGTICLKLGIDIRVIADMLGHSNLNSIKWYTHVYSNIRNEAIEKWNTK